jgi:hypothetical protein
MQQHLAALERTLADFVVQRDHAAMIVRCGEDELPIVTRTVEGLDEASTSELFWIAVDDFVEPASYAEALVQAFRVKHSTVRLAMAQEGMTPWPELPAAATDRTLRPAERIRAVMAFSRELVPGRAGVSVWALIPTRIADHAAWGALLADLLQHRLPRPWFHGLRLVLRAERRDPAVPAALAATQRVLWYEPDVGMDAVLRAIDQAVDDESLPMDVRAQNAFLSASLDSAHGRTELAIRKLATLLRYYGGTKDGAMTSLVLATLGNLYTRAGDAARGAALLESALAPAALAPHPPVPVLLSVTQQLAERHLAAQQFAQAEGYYDSLRRLAVLQRSPDILMSATDTVGYTQYMQGRVGDALKTWFDGVKLAEGLGLNAPRAAMLSRLRWYYEQTGNAQAVQAIDVRLATPVAPVPSATPIGGAP